MIGVRTETECGGLVDVSAPDEKIVTFFHVIPLSEL
jgi:hypothetical protein